MGGGGWFNLIPQLPDFAGAGLNYGLFRAQSKNYASQVRHLRRREYQDMMFSMKAAGLNPILASGATPGHSAGMMDAGNQPSSSAGVGSAMAANRQAGVGERNVKVTELKAPNEIATEYMRRFGIASEIAQRGANVELTAATTAKTKAETELALQESGSAAVKRLLHQRQAEREGYTSKQIEALTKQINEGYNLTPGNIVGHGGYKVGEEDRRRTQTREYHAEDNLGKYFGSAKEWLRGALRSTTHED